jgi:hypothetical protein
MKVFRKFNSIIHLSATLERLFLAGGEIFIPKHKMLGDTKLKG